MIRTLLIVFLIASFCRVNCQSNSHRQLSVRYVNFSIETFFSINCDFFPTAFSKDQYKIWEPSQKEIIDSIEKLSNSFKGVDWPSADVRASIDWTYKGKKYHYCFDRFGHFSDGKRIYKNKALFKLLKKWIPIVG